MRAIRTILIDNYDSYTYNLFQQIAVINGVPPTVIHNDQISLADLQSLISTDHFDNIVISPGPGTPERCKDVGVSMDLVAHRMGVPVLGVCLGMQALAHAHGAAVVRGPEPVHGRLSSVRHSGHPLFRGIPSGPEGGFTVVRYHSLVVDESSLPPHLPAIAWTCGSTQPVRPASGQASSSVQGDGSSIVMAIAHAEQPLFGVQFHPESVATAFGDTVLKNFRDLTIAQRGLLMPHEVATPLANGHCTHKPIEDASVASMEVRFVRIKSAVTKGMDDQYIFHALYGASGGSDAFWLDRFFTDMLVHSAATDRGRFSFMGGREGVLWKRITYSLPAEGPPSSSNPGRVCVEDVQGRTQHIATLWWPYLEQLLCTYRCTSDASLPFDFCGGLVGYLGYELKAECGVDAPYRSNLPDAAFFLVDRFVALDHETGDVYLVALVGASSSRNADQWLRQREADVARVLQSTDRISNGEVGSGPMSQTDMSSRQEGKGSVNHSDSTQSDMPIDEADDNRASRNGNGNGQASYKAEGQGGKHKERMESYGSAETSGHCLPEVLGPFHLHRPREVYMQDVQACKDALYAGESYELCLTTALSRRGHIDALKLYYTLRRLSPAPYAAFLSFGADGLQVCSSSPERFLRGNRSGDLEARPIKGTASRCADSVADAAAAAALAASEKDQAENLMIVDLLRNDLGRVCEVGSIHVPVLMDVESYAVHSLVSTVRGKRRPGASIVDCLKATFPGGSMTGAPKLRSMQILDRLEKEARGIYSGSLGFLSFNGAFDLNIVIRTAVLDGQQITIGAGGAIVVQSDPRGEYEEMRLKAKALLRAFGEVDGSGSPVSVDDTVPFAER